MPTFFLPLRSTQKAGKNIILYLDFIFYLKWVTSIYNADAGTVAKLMESNIHFKCFIYELAAKRYSTVVWVMQQILFAHFDERMARFLLSRYEKTGDSTIRMTQEAMAQEVNSAREVVARMLRQFESDGLIELNRGIVILKNIELLKNIAE